KTYNWGIIGPGKIAHLVMAGLQQIPDARLYATASLTPGKAEAFSKQYNAPKWYTSYEELTEDPEVDIIYIATTNQLHMYNTILALNNGKPVLCEKPMAVNAMQVQKMIDAAKKNNLFLMEAMWSRFFPVMYKLRELLAQKVIGDIRVVAGDLSYTVPGHDLSDPGLRQFNPDCAGGGLIDCGIYPLAFACMVFGKTPDRVSGLATMTPLNVDAHSVAVVGFEGGGIASIYSGIDAKSGGEAHIYGSKGHIRIPNFTHADTLEIYPLDQEMEKIVIPYSAPGYQFEMIEVQRCIEEGLLESPLMPLQESLEIAETFDKIRMLWNYKYPFE
ncbi:MAG: Gfo/Idh/MocA family oxidoreductase, partial [Actinobacteria bacterium]|nr:Gfo/Idh/MocA family oxidoreductase [Actinomycetota bacterium]